MSWREAEVLCGKRTASLSRRAGAFVAQQKINLRRCRGSQQMALSREGKKKPNMAALPVRTHMRQLASNFTIFIFCHTDDAYPFTL